MKNIDATQHRLADAAQIEENIDATKEPEGHLQLYSMNSDATVIATVGTDGLIRLWNRQGDLLHTLSMGYKDCVHPSVPYKPIRRVGEPIFATSVTISRDGDTVVSTSDWFGDLTIHVKDKKGNYICVFRTVDPYGIDAIAIRPDGNTIVVGSSDGTVRFLDKQGKLLRQFSMHLPDRPVSGIAISSDGKVIAGFYFEKIAFIPGEDNFSPHKAMLFWSDRGKPLMQQFLIGQRRYDNIKISERGRAIISIGGYRHDSIRLWNKRGNLITDAIENAVKRDSSVEIDAIGISPEGDTILVGSSDGMIRCYDRKCQSMGILLRHEKGISSIDVSSDGKTIVSTDKAGKVYVWDRESNSLCSSFVAVHRGSVGAIAISSDGNTIVSSRDCAVQLWNNKGELSNISFKGHTKSVEAVAVSADGNTIVSGGNDSTVRIWNRKGEPLCAPLTKLKRNAPSIAAVAVSLDGDTVVSGSKHGEIGIWNRRGTPLCPFFSDHKASIRSISVSADGRTIASGDDKGTVYLWNRRGEPIGELLKGHTNPVVLVSVSPDGNIIFSGYRDGTVRFWERRGILLNETRTAYVKDIGTITSFAVSADSKTIVSGDRNGRICLWDWQGVLLYKPFIAHRGSVSSVAMISEGSVVVSAGFGGIRFWNRQGTPLSAAANPSK